MSVPTDMLQRATKLGIEKMFEAPSTPQICLICRHEVPSMITIPHIEQCLVKYHTLMGTTCQQKSRHSHIKTTVDKPMRTTIYVTDML